MPIRSGRSEACYKVFQSKNSNRLSRWFWWMAWKSSKEYKKPFARSVMNLAQNTWGMQQWTYLQRNQTKQKDSWSEQKRIKTAQFWEKLWPTTRAISARLDRIAEGKSTWSRSIYGWWNDENKNWREDKKISTEGTLDEGQRSTTQIPTHPHSKNKN